MQRHRCQQHTTLPAHVDHVEDHAATELHTRKDGDGKGSISASSFHRQTDRQRETDTESQQTCKNDDISFFQRIFAALSKLYRTVPSQQPAGHSSEETRYTNVLQNIRNKS